MTLSLSGYNKVVLSVGNGAKEAAESAVSAAASASDAYSSASAAAVSAAEALSYTTTASGNLAAEVARAQAAEALLAPKNSPAFTGTPTVPTAAAGTNTTQAASTAFVTAGLASKAPLASPALTGTPTAPTAAIGTNSTRIATTEFATTLGNRVLATSSILLDSVSGTNTITASHSPAASGVTPAQAGQIYVMKNAGTNTTSAVTLAVGGGAALPVYDAHGAMLSAGDLRAGDYITLACVSGTSYRVISTMMTPAQVRAEFARSLAASLYGTYGGSANAITVTAGLSSIAIGTEIRFRATAANTGPTTLNVDGTGAIPCLTITGAVLPAGYILTTVTTVARYNGAYWVLGRDPERNSNASGDYVRFADGTQICTRTADLGSVIANGAGTWASPYYTNPVTLTYAAAFAAVPTLSFSFPISGGAITDRIMVPAGFTVGGVSVSPLRVARLGDGNDNMSVTCVMTAVGRWY